MDHLLSIASILATAGSLLANQAAPIAYTPGSTGHDISFPQCGGAYPAGAFGIVGVNGGYPFVHYNPCLADEYAHTPKAALYINTGYDPLYTQVDGRHTIPECRTSSAVIKGSADQRAAWAVGCSEASRSMAFAASQGVTKPGGWWLDVETENNWSSTDLSLNQYTIQGIVDTFYRTSSVAVGIYSTGYQWGKITGGLPVSGVKANWVATGSLSAEGARAGCGTGFSGAPVWLVQYILGGFDTNYVC
ncbi:MAG: hypothetical protein M3Z28_11480 [Candidatus Dormibacteraeota bacterium]|nr:hypothetical protein [Candidatus Dormibacteraeota bacterium]